jgi:hypothetical protein
MADVRRCIGSARFGIEPHDAPVAEFPSQPSQKDGLGRMCKTHWNAYTAGLARDAKERRAATVAKAAAVVAEPPVASEPVPAKANERRRKAKPVDEAGVIEEGVPS